MIDSVHYFSKNNNCITVNTILDYISKRTRLAQKMTTANVNEKVTWIPSFVFEDTPISFIIIHDGIKDVVVNRKSEL